MACQAKLTSLQLDPPALLWLCVGLSSGQGGLSPGIAGMSSTEQLHVAVRVHADSIRLKVAYVRLCSLHKLLRAQVRFTSLDMQRGLTTGLQRLLCSLTCMHVSGHQAIDCQDCTLALMKHPVTL